MGNVVKRRRHQKRTVGSGLHLQPANHRQKALAGRPVRTGVGFLAIQPFDGNPVRRPNGNHAGGRLVGSGPSRKRSQRPVLAVLASSWRGLTCTNPPLAAVHHFANVCRSVASKRQALHGLCVDSTIRAHFEVLKRDALSRICFRIATGLDGQAATISVAHDLDPANPQSVRPSAKACLRHLPA